MKQLLKSLMKWMGFDLVRIRNNHSSLDFHLKNVFEKYQIECVLDVGANIGQYGESLRALGYKGWIVSFEPVKAVFDELNERAKNDAKWICYHCALGDEVGKKIINVYSSSVFSSFLTANAYSKGIWKSLEKSAPEEVTIRRLDDVLPEIMQLTNCKRYYLKLDTQGYDLQAFRGSRASLANIYAAQTELSLIHVYGEMTEPYEMLNTLQDNGYFVSGMYPINRDSSLAVIEFDCILVKRCEKK